ncbi:DUF602-domain-containing protein [Serendipita vermifera]|nr:DUF602-domain-containing protein [Serendipita vermifera]
MGNDGGSIPDRRDLVKTKAKAEQADKQNQILAKWFFCALSKRPLQEPIVSCELGKLYNKDAIVEFLLDRTTYGDGETICGHVKSLKDVTQLNLTPNPAPASSSSVDETGKRAQFVCPLTLKEMNGGLPFVYLSTCGCVFSAAGLRALASPAEVPSPSSSGASDDKKDETAPKKALLSCPQCSKPYDRTADVRSLNPSPEEEDTMREAMEVRKAARKTAAKNKKRKAAEITGNDASDGQEHKKAKTTEAPKPSNLPKTSTSVAVMARRVAESMAEEEMKRKSKMSEAVASLYGPKDGASKKKETFMTRGTFTRYA